MSIRRYRYELIVALALLVAVVAFFYKQAQRSSIAEANRKMSKELAVFQETAGLKKIWADKEIGKRLDRLKGLVPQEKVSWKKRGKKLTASFQNLKPSEVNTLVTKFLNIAVQVVSLKVRKEGERYRMEIQCKW